MKWNAARGYDLLLILALQLVIPSVGVGFWIMMGGNEAHLEAYAYILSPPLSLLIILLVLALRGHMGDLADFFRPLPSFKKLLLWGGGGAFLVLVAGEGTAYALSRWIPLQENNPLVTDPGAFTQPMIVALFLSAGLMAPLGEELLYRGLLLDFLRPWGTWGAAFLSSVAFAFAHGLWTLFLPLLAIGLILAFLRLRGGTLWFSITAHALFNLASLSLALMPS
ncbi:MAG: CPBP family intramembrane metalloprotease [Bacillota bacterium]|nr:CPBP family intramembrane metalloprotease [Bacillota bacterium]